MILGEPVVFRHRIKRTGISVNKLNTLKNWKKSHDFGKYERMNFQNFPLITCYHFRDSSNTVTVLYINTFNFRILNDTNTHTHACPICEDGSRIHTTTAAPTIGHIIGNERGQAGKIGNRTCFGQLYIYIYRGAHYCVTRL